MIDDVPYREREGGPKTLVAVADPLARFLEIVAALETGGGLLQDKVPLRFAAVTLMTTDGDASDLAAEVRTRCEELDATFSWTSPVSKPIRLLLAAQLVKNRDTTEAFLDHANEVESLFRKHRLRRSGAYEVQAALVFWRLLDGQSIADAHVIRFKAIYEQLKRYHWFLTGPDDFAACAMLVGQPGTPEEIGAGIEEIYVALNDEGGLWQGEALQTAANVLYLLPLSAQEITRRFIELNRGLGEVGIRVGTQGYDEVATLCFLAQPIPRITETVAGYTEELQRQISWLSKSMAFGLATSLAFVRLLSSDRDLAALGDAKLLLDMQAIVAARAAAVAAAS